MSSDTPNTRHTLQSALRVEKNECPVCSSIRTPTDPALNSRAGLARCCQKNTWLQKHVATSPPLHTQRRMRSANKQTPVRPSVHGQATFETHSRARPVLARPCVRPFVVLSSTKSQKATRQHTLCCNTRKTHKHTAPRSAIPERFDLGRVDPNFSAKRRRGDGTAAAATKSRRDASQALARLTCSER